MKQKSTPKISVDGKQEKCNPPKDLKEHPFFGLKLDKDQEEFRDAIWSDDYDIIFCDSKAGTGKTTLAVATAMLLREYGKYSGIVYQVAGGVHEGKQGLLPGSLEEKSAPLFIPLYQAVARLNYDPSRVIVNDYNMAYQKCDSPMIIAQTDSYIRGISIGEADCPMVIIYDEMQNETFMGVKTALTRVNAGSKVIVIGCRGQCDLKYPQDSGFERFLNHFSTRERCKVCTLTKNYRGWISAWADEL